MGMGFRELFILAVVVGVYFLPNWVASSRNHHNKNAIFWLNLLAGWTLLGWLAALIWALTAVDTEKNAATMPCPYCAEPIQKAAQLCRFCGKTLPR